MIFTENALLRYVEDFAANTGTSTTASFPRRRESSVSNSTTLGPRLRGDDEINRGQTDSRLRVNDAGVFGSPKAINQVGALTSAAKSNTRKQDPPPARATQ